MDRTERRDAIAALLKQAAEAHHEAFAATDGVDPDWALWYGEHLAEKLPALLGAPLEEVDLVRALADLDEEHRARDPEADWPQYYADMLLEHHASEANETLSLYLSPGCPYCHMVVRVIDQLGIREQIELRDIWQDDQHRRDLVAARGRGTVPVLRCQKGDVDRWMPESRDIMRYLQKRFGDRS